MSRLIKVSIALALLAVLVGVWLAWPQAGQVPTSKGRDWHTTWACDIVSYQVQNDTYSIYCMQGMERYIFDVYKPTVYHNQGKNSYELVNYYHSNDYGVVRLARQENIVRLVG